jgi:hypothetical protein
MRSIQLAEVFASIIGGMAPAAALAGCGDAGCDPNVASHLLQTLIVAADGGISQQFEDLPEGGTRSSPMDGGTGSCLAACQGYAALQFGCGRVEAAGCRIVSSDGSSTTIECDMNYFPVCPMGGAVCGRRPLHARPAPLARRGPISLQGLFAEMALLERDSVPAFRDLAASLAAHRAPSPLIERSRRAARDEARHTRMMARLAGLTRLPVGSSRRRRGNAPGLEVVVEDNVIEGCVRETFGALVATWQARHAARRDVRETMRAVAADETEHAALAWDIHAWGSTQLMDAAMARVRAAAERAVRELRRELDVEVPLDVLGQAGLPSRAEAKTLLSGLAHALWERLADPVSPPVTSRR